MNRLICRLFGHRKVWRARWEGFEYSRTLDDLPLVAGFFWLDICCKRCDVRLSTLVVYPMAPRQLTSKRRDSI